MGHVLGHGAGLAALAAAVWLSGAVLEALWVRVDLGPWRGLARFELGLVYWTAALFVLAASGHLSRPGLGLAAAPLALAAVAGRRRLAAGGLARPWSWPWSWPWRRPRGATAVDLLAAGVVAVVLAGTFLLALTPTVSWDASVYHLSLPRLYLEAGGFRPVPMNVYSQWPHAVELLYGAAMLVGDYVLAKTVHFGFGLLVLYALFVATRAAEADATRSVPWLAAGLFLANEVVAFELRVAYVDVAHAFFFFTAFLFFDRALAAEEPERARTFFLLAGLAAGTMAAIKLTGVVGVAAIAALALPHLVRELRAGRAGPTLRALLLRFALPVAVLALPWLVKTGLATGNPFYPFFYAALGGPDWSVELGERLAAWQRAIGMGRGPLDYLLLPFRVALLGGMGYQRFDGRIGPFWLLVVPLALMIARRLPPARRAVVLRPLAVAGLFFVFWALSSQQMRFLVPLLPLLALAGALGLGEILARPLAAGWRRATLAVALVTVVVVHAGSVVAGFRSLVVFLRFEGDLEASVVPDAYRFVDEHLPADALLLMVNTNQRFFLEREVLADSFFEASQLGAWLGGVPPAEVRRRLAARGVTHVLVDLRLPRPHAGWSEPLMRLLDDPAQARTLFVSSDGRFVVSELR